MEEQRASNSQVPGSSPGATTIFVLTCRNPIGRGYRLRPGLLEVRVLPAGYSPTSHSPTGRGIGLKIRVFPVQIGVGRPFSFHGAAYPFYYPRCRNLSCFLYASKPRSGKTPRLANEDVLIRSYQCLSTLVVGRNRNSESTLR